jgi:hypothetical protein
MTEKAELDRVRFIHQHLDLHAAHPVPSDNGKLYVMEPGGRTHTYTESEIKAWPAMKANMIRGLSGGGHYDRCAIDPFDKREPMTTCGFGNGPSSGAPEDYRPQYARGLCLYREQLASAPEPSATAGEGKLCDATAEAILDYMLGKPAEQPKSDPYVSHRKALAAHNITEANLHTFPRDVDQVAKREAARARNVAALRRELDRPTERRFPHPGRNFALEKFR